MPSSPSSGRSSRHSAGLLLRVHRPDGPADEFYLASGLTIGRSAANSIVLADDESVDRTHARVEFADDGSARLRCVEPGGSLTVDGVAVEEAPLVEGMRFQIGRIRFECVSGRREVGGASRQSWSTCPFCGSAAVPTAGDGVRPCPECRNPVLPIPLDPHAPDPVLVPAVYGAYRAERYVARGGMGLVLKGAREGGGEGVAIKVLLPGAIPDRCDADQFEREVAMLERVRHPNVVKLLDHGTAGRCHYLVLEWVEGPSLREVIADARQLGKLPDFADAVRWFGQVGKGLAAIHAVGVVHRDLKPSNILIGPDRVARIADLGIARRVDAGHTSYTTTGHAPGTFEYMAPEQLCAPDTVDGRADLYALGVTFYELLTGTRPVGAWRPASDVNPTVPKGFDEVLRRLLAPRPDQRYGDIFDLLPVVTAFRGLPTAPITSRAGPAATASPVEDQPTRSPRQGPWHSEGRRTDSRDRQDEHPARIVGSMLRATPLGKTLQAGFRRLPSDAVVSRFFRSTCERGRDAGILGLYWGGGLGGVVAALFGFAASATNDTFSALTVITTSLGAMILGMLIGALFGSAVGFTLGALGLDTEGRVRRGVAEDRLRRGIGPGSSVPLPSSASPRPAHELAERGAEGEQARRDPIGAGPGAQRGSALEYFGWVGRVGVEVSASLIRFFSPRPLFASPEKKPPLHERVQAIPGRPEHPLLRYLGYAGALVIGVFLAIVVFLLIALFLAMVNSNHRQQSNPLLPRHPWTPPPASSRPDLSGHPRIVTPPTGPKADRPAPEMMPGLTDLVRTGRAIELIRRHQPDAAIRECDAAIPLGQSLQFVYGLRGLAFALKKDFPRALADCEKAIELDGRKSTAYVYRARVYIEKNDFDAAFADCDRAIASDPKNAMAYACRAIAGLGRGPRDSALADGERAVKLAPYLPEVYLARGAVRLAGGQLDAALADFDEAIRRDPAYADAYEGRAIVHIARNEFDPAIVDADRLIGLDRKDAQGWLYRGTAHSRKGEYDHAISDLARAIELDPSLALARNNRGLAYLDKGDRDHALADFDEAIKLDPKLSDPYANRALAHLGQGDPDRALADCNRAIELDPSNAEALFARGSVYNAKGDADRAIPDFSEALRLNPPLAPAFNGRGVAYHKKGELDRALADFDEAIRLDPGDPGVFANRGLTRQMKGDLDAAVADFRSALQLDPPDAPRYRELLRAAESARRPGGR